MIRFTKLLSPFYLIYVFRPFVFYDIYIYQVSYFFKKCFCIIARKRNVNTHINISQYKKEPYTFSDTVKIIS